MFAWPTTKIFAERIRALMPTEDGVSEMRTHELKSWLRVDAEGLRSERELECWIARGISYARTLPRKAG